MILSAVLMPAPEGGFTALNPEIGTTTQGETVEEAIANLRDATSLDLEEFPLEVSGQALLTTLQVALEHDRALRSRPVGQARNPGMPIDLADHSVKEPMSGNWLAG